MRRPIDRLVQLTTLAGCAAIALLGVRCGAAAPLAQHVSAGCGDRREIALTFDDGPNPPFTDTILGLLTAAGVHATFFDEGEAIEAHPEVIEREISAGMAIGSHSYAHSTELPNMTAREFGADRLRAALTIEAAAGFVPALYRAPYGHQSNTMLRDLREAGYLSVGWDIDSKDWSDASADEVVQNVLTHAHPGGIVLMHDGGLGGGNPDRTTTTAALPRILDGLRAQGYALVTIPELTGVPEAQPDGHPVRSARSCSAN